MDKFLETVVTKQLIDEFWWQQDGATAHRTQEVFDRLKEWFGENIIGLDAPLKTGGGLDWPPNSPDLTPPDYFLWSYLKDRVYKNNPKNIVELKNNIENTLKAIPSDILRKVAGNFVIRIRELIKVGGKHFEHILH